MKFSSEVQDAKIHYAAERSLLVSLKGSARAALVGYTDVLEHIVRRTAESCLLRHLYSVRNGKSVVFHSLRT